MQESLFCCPKNQNDPSRCKFFKWTNKPAIEPPRCPKHGIKCVRNIVRKETANKGRAFYSCPAEKNCLFKWEDELSSMPSNEQQPTAAIDFQIVGNKNDDFTRDLVQSNQFYVLITLPGDLPSIGDVISTLEEIPDAYTNPASTLCSLQRLNFFYHI